MAIGLETLRGDDDDAGGALARLVPPGGATAEGYEKLVELFFGDSPPRWDAATEDAGQLRAKAQATLTEAVSKLKADRRASLRLKLRSHSLAASWAEAQGDAPSGLRVTLLEDGPLGKAGAALRAAREDVVDYLLVLPGGVVRSPRDPAGHGEARPE